MFLVAEVQDSTCPHLNPLLAFTTKAHVMLTDAKFQDVDTSSVCPMKDSQSWSYLSAKTTDGNPEKEPV